MTFIKWANGQHTADFECCDKVKIRIRGKAMFRDDNSTLTLGRDGRYYFVFTMPKDMVHKLPMLLVRQASAIAQKVIRELLTLNTNL